MEHISYWFMLTVLIYWVEANNTIKENAKALVVASKEDELDVNDDKTK